MRKVLVRLLVVSIFFTGASAGIQRICPWSIDGPAAPVWKSVNEIYTLKNGIVMFWLDHERFPTDLDEYYRLQPPVSSSNTIDNFGNKYLYRLTEGDPRFIVYSAGPNGLDESGLGDDIPSDGEESQYEFNCPQYYPCPSYCEYTRTAAFGAAILSWAATIFYMIYSVLLAAVRVMFPSRD